MQLVEEAPYKPFLASSICDLNFCSNDAHLTVFTPLYDLHSKCLLSSTAAFEITVWRETLAVEKFGEFTTKSYWWNKIWQICYVASQVSR